MSVLVTIVMAATLAAPGPAAVPDDGVTATLVAPAPASTADGLTATLARGGAAVAAGHYAEAEAAYTDATHLEPRSEDAWLGLQLARVAREDWEGATLAGARVLVLNPDSFWAHARQAWARFNQGRYANARAQYEAALALSPGDAEMTLGLGFTLARLGDEGGARVRCDAAAAALGDDPRVAACREAAEVAAGKPVVGAALSGTWVGNAKGSVERVTSGVVVASVRWPAVSLWAGVTASSAAGVGGTSETLGAAHVGVELRAGAFTGVLAGGLLKSDSSATDGGGFAVARLGVAAGAWTLGVRGAVMRLPGGNTAQVDPSLGVRLGAATLTAGPEVAVVNGATLVSRHLRVDVALSERLGLWASGYYGRREYPVDADGLEFWTGSDRFRGGYRVGLRWTPADWLALSLTWRHDLVKDTQGNGYGYGASTSLYGATLGVGVDF